ncbi:MAG: FkbM family methyltransferase [Candidatus Methanomethylicaceae archaeon]
MDENKRKAHHVLGMTMRRSFVKVGLRVVGMLPQQLREKWSRSRLASLPRRAVTEIIGQQGPGLYRIEAGPLRGMMMKTDLREYRGYILGTYEPLITARITEIAKPGFVCMDIGAHHGYYTLLMSRLVGESGRVYSFEPDTKNYSYLVETINVNGLTNVESHNIGIREVSGRFALCRERSSSMNRVLPISEMERKPNWSEINAVSLDDFIVNSEIEKLDFVKIDVEGSENEVLKGMQVTLDNLAPVVLCEFHNDSKLKEGIYILKQSNYCVDILKKNTPSWVIATPARVG